MTELVVENSPIRLHAWAVYGAPIAIMAGIFVLSSRTRLPEVDGGGDLQYIAGHFAAYAALGASLAVLLRWHAWPTARVIVIAIVLATLYGVTDEFHQSFVPNRSSDSRDVLVDFLGATAGTLAVMRFIDWRDASPAKSSGAGQDQRADESS